jgi:hypothetical protein
MDTESPTRNARSEVNVASPASNTLVGWFESPDIRTNAKTRADPIASESKKSMTLGSALLKNAWPACLNSSASAVES